MRESRVKGLKEVTMTEFRHVLVLEVYSKYNTVFVDFRYFHAIHAFVYHSSTILTFHH